MSEQDLLTQLGGVRRRARRLAVMHGLLVVGASGVAAFLGMGLLDFLLDLPSALRLAMSLGFVAAAGVALRRLVWRPAVGTVRLEDVAQRIERRFHTLNDRLTSTVNFLQNADGGSSILVQQVVSETSGMAAALPLQDVLTRRPVWRTLGLMLCISLALGGIDAAAPGFSLTGLKRFSVPFGSTQWPKRVQIEPVSGNAKVPLGGSFTVAMRVTRGRHDGLRAWVHTTDERNRRRRALLKFDPGDGVYRRTFEGLAGGFGYWFEAGDDRAPATPARVTVVRRPAVAGASFRVTPPAYVPDGRTVEVSLDDRAVTILTGSRVELAVETNKPIATAAADQASEMPAALQFGAGAAVPLSPTDESRQYLRGAFSVTASDTFEIRLVGVDGFENRGRTTYQLVAGTDEAPVVVIVEPQSVLEVTPGGRVAMRIDADDDYGLSTLRLTYRVDASDTDAHNDLTERLDVHESAGRYAARVPYEWALAPLKLQPGDLVLYRAEVTDNFELEGRRHDPSSSPTMRLKVVSEAAFAERLRDEFRLLASRLRRVLTQQQTLRDEVDALAADVGRADKSLSEADRDALDQIGARQGTATARTEQLSGQFKRLGRRMAMNEVRDTESRRRAEQAGEQLAEIAGEPMREARRSIQQARQAEQVDAQREALEKTGTQQQAAIDAMERLIAGMNRWGDFHEVVERTRDVLDRQQQVSKQTKRVASKTLGKAAEQLSREESSALRGTARDQARLAEDAERLLQQMEDVARASSKRDAAASDLLQQSARKARAAGVSRRMKEAAKAVERNQGGQAAREQAAAEAGLQAMLDQLEQRQARELAQLAKRLEKADEAIRLLLEQQTQLRADNVAARDHAEASALLRGLSETQSVLQRNTQQLAEEMGGNERLTQVSRTVARAGARMSQAAAKLGHNLSKPAEAHQTAAIERLEEALRQLDILRRRTDEKLAAKALADIRKALQRVRDGQAEIKTRTAAMIERLGKTKRLSRADVRRLRQLARGQEKLIETATALRREIASAVVYDWVMRRVIERMGDARTRFEDRRVDAETMAVQDKVLVQLDRLLDAAKADERPAGAESSFAGGGGSGQGGQGGQTNPIPPAKQLRVLKMMQHDINDRTVSLDKTIEPATASEAELQELKDLAAEQREVRELLEQMVAGPRRGGG